MLFLRLRFDVIVLRSRFVLDFFSGSAVLSGGSVPEMTVCSRRSHLGWFRNDLIQNGSLIYGLML